MTLVGRRDAVRQAAGVWNQGEVRIAEEAEPRFVQTANKAHKHARTHAHD